MRRALCALALFAGCTPTPSSRPAPSASAAPRVVASAAPRAVASAAPSASAPDRHPAPPPAAAAIALRAGGKRAVRGDRGLVTSVESHATHVGVATLEAGGNAVDAAVAVAYALAVVHPSAGNIGGGGFMLVHMKGHDTVAVDFRESAPGALTRQVFDTMILHHAVGPAAVGVPGSVAGLELAHDRFGKLARAAVLKPAIDLARGGHAIGDREAKTIRWAWPVLSRDKAAKQIFGDGDKPKTRGEKLRRPDLARTLERIAKQGRDGFYTGTTAKRLVRALGGRMSMDDLASYRAIVREPIRITYRGLDVETMPPPSAGGVAVAEELELLDRLQVWKEEAGSARELHLFLEASRRAQADRRFDVVDPETLSHDALAARLAHWTDPAWLAARAPAIDRDHATPSKQVDARFDAAMREFESEHTTHFSVVDAEGNVVSCTTTLSSGFGARIVAPGTGVVLNNSVASFGTLGDDTPAPGRRTVSSMAPTLVLQSGEVALVLGSPGGDTIPSTVVQVLRNLVDRGMTIDQAVDAPRVHQDFAPDLFRYERARPIPASVRQALEAMGHHVSHKTLPIGDANDILIQGGVAWGYADRREGGLALGAR